MIVGATDVTQLLVYIFGGLATIFTPIVAGLLGWMVRQLMTMSRTQASTAAVTGFLEERMTRVEHELWPVPEGQVRITRTVEAVKNASTA